MYNNITGALFLVCAAIYFFAAKFQPLESVSLLLFGIHLVIAIIFFIIPLVIWLSGYILYSTSKTTIRIDFSADDIAVWDGIDLDGLLEESVKQ
ncbi:MAG: hypothetical protein FWD31_05360, partial [Planctomycetaceae bacterium]|nr:hypothetical protein [Planctomycetaceae bacterium]